MDDARSGTAPERFELRLYVASDEQLVEYIEEHWFAERPPRDTVLMLWEEAKATFAALYPDDEPADCSVEVSRLRPKDDFRPVFPRSDRDRPSELP